MDQMIKMKPLIDDLKSIKETLAGQGDPIFASVLDRSIACVEKQQIFNVTITVECKDCTQWCRNIGVVDSPNGHCYYHEIETNGHDFCSYGKRRIEDVEEN